MQIEEYSPTHFTGGKLKLSYFNRITLNNFDIACTSIMEIKMTQKQSYIFTLFKYVNFFSYIIWNIFKELLYL